MGAVSDPTNADGNGRVGKFTVAMLSYVADARHPGLTKDPIGLHATAFLPLTGALRHA